MKKALCMATAGIMTLSAMGCGATKTEYSSPQKETAQETKQKSETVEIEFWYGLGGTLGDEINQYIQEFNESQDEVKVVGVQQGDYGETSSLLQAAIASGEVPAAALFSNADLYTFHEAGVLQGLEDYIANDPDFNKENFLAGYMGACTTDDGEMFALPFKGSTQIMYYRMDAFENAGIDPEEAFSTWESLAAAAEQMTVKEDGETVFYGWEPMYGEVNLIDMSLSNGASILSEDGTKVLIDSEAFVEPWECIRKWIHEDKIMRIHYGGEGWEYWYKTIDDVMENRAAGYIGSVGDQGDLDFTQIAAHVQPGFGENEAAPVMHTDAVGIIKKASEEEKEAAFKWLSYLTSTEVNCRFAMASGYMPVRNSSLEDAAYKKYLEENPQALVAFEQAEIASEPFMDPTGGKITQALVDAADLVEIENVPATEALKQAQEIAQAALDEYLDQQ